MNLSSDQTKKQNACIVHDWLITMRGGEKVLEAIAELFPDAPIHTLFYDRKNLSPSLQSRTIHASFLQFIPGITKVYRWLLPIFPLAISMFDLNKFDLIISSSHCVAKGVQTRKNTIHICYCHTPMRYLWEFGEEYFGHYPVLVRKIIERFFKWLRRWDYNNSQKVTAFIANSKNVAKKIQRFYGKQAVVIHPPLDIKPSPSQNGSDESYYLIVNALVPYKRIDLAIRAFNHLKKPLKIVGNGPLLASLKKMAIHDKITFEGWLSPDKLLECYKNAKALIFPGEEDFGISPLEAQAFGKPVIGYGKGGLLETVIPYNDPYENRAAEKSTGMFFFEQTTEALEKAVKIFEASSFNPNFIRSHTIQFDRTHFQSKFIDFLNDLRP